MDCGWGGGRGAQHGGRDTPRARSLGEKQWAPLVSGRRWQRSAGVKAADSLRAGHSLISFQLSNLITLETFLQLETRVAEWSYFRRNKSSCMAMLVLKLLGLGYQRRLSLQFPNKSRPHSRGEYNVYSTFQSHEPEFDYLKSLEIEEKINKIRWLPQQNAAHFLLSTNDKTIKLWKISERDKKAEGYNLKDEDGRLRDPFRITALRVPILKPMDLMVEASPRRIFANAHTYHINSISVNSDHETYLSADDLRINLWHLEITDRSFNIVDIKPMNMEELTEVITAAEFHPHQCNVLVYSSSKGTIRLCDMRSSALCDRHSKFFEEPEDPSSRSFFSEIISSISDVKFSHSGRYMMTRDYLSVKVWDLNMETRPVETYQVHEYLRSKLCSLYENDCIFDKFECCWNGSDGALMTGSYNNFFRMFDRSTRRDVTLEASRESSKPRAILKPRKVCTGGKRKKDEISVDSLDFNKKILHTAWHPLENIIAVAATNNLYIFQDKVN
ncbi:serine/threonine-protein phosphatase 2A 55 kDa regulatory subunit B delta isoform isoform X1 [Trichosurus vulpecula]|uniref:serine/threonine-protein phosphatase 2A 55 kDa regulatory subunit B delta isoform isoform X1 n=2 Tax=Trichosurus vulpecula TaxID=9337 RepID=UPI00186B522D|nr:serine/threonine-protein phosphatase 2A 55 kDa regulatory subunit B delta isoform isoform X1 [Trichosurus vulpecula]